MKINIKSLYLNLRKQPVVSLVSIIGTALAIFLVMVVVMLTEVRTADISPESNRSRTLYQTYISAVNMENDDNRNSGYMSYKTVKSLFQPMNAPEMVTAYVAFIEEAIAVDQVGRPLRVSLRQVDDCYWKVFEYDFVAGHPFDRSAFESGQKVAVMTENTARTIFGSADVVGREFSLDHIPYRVTGVVKDVSPLAKSAFGHVFVPFTATGRDLIGWGGGQSMGMLEVAILAKSRDDFEKIRAEFNSNLVRYNKELELAGWRMNETKGPYDIESRLELKSATVDPDVKSARNRRWLIYAIMLLVPTINISSMTESRLRRRASEIGIRRAFGCTRGETMLMVLMENFIVTVFAGIIGLLLSVTFAIISQDFLFNISTLSPIESAAVDVSSLMHWSTFLYALLFCFILNLLSSGIPAYRASRQNIVNAISGLRK